MSTIKLELKVTDTRSNTFKVCLKVADENQVTHWSQDPVNAKIYQKTFEDYEVDGDTLPIFLSCKGYDAEVSCEVKINGISRRTLKTYIPGKSSDSENYTISITP